MTVGSSVGRSFLHLKESSVSETRSDTCHQVGPQCNLRTVERSLLNKALGAVAGIGGQNPVGLIGGIA